ncbi:MAG: MazG nucleotide pyrophosphohydrolase domain-containing protein [Candidatus Methanofastidiosia archaeon]
MEVKEIQRIADALSKLFGSRKDPFRALAVVTEELGEVASDINKMYGSGAKDYQGKKTTPEALREEMGDLVLSIFHLANEVGIDLDIELEEKKERIRAAFDMDI